MAEVISRFRECLPHASIYAYDNDSEDSTYEIAAQSGAIVRREPRRGKGYVVRRMFADVSADIYVLCDADLTYQIDAAPALIGRLWDEGLDMLVGSRQPVVENAYRAGHAFGNRMLTGLVRAIFGKGFNDMLSGYRVFSRRFVKSFPAMSQGFELETELTIHALELEMPTAEVETRFNNRPVGSTSKLNTYRDGTRIMLTILNLLKQERPLFSFGWTAVALALISLGLGYPLFVEFAETGLVPRFPTAILASAMMLVACMFFFSGLILDTVSRGRREAKRLKYLEFNGIYELKSEIERRALHE